MLPAFPVDRLVEVPFPIKETHSHERKAEVVRRLEEVSREHSEPSRIDRQRLGQAEFGAEVRDPFSPSPEAAHAGVRRLRHVLEREVRCDRMKGREKRRIVRGRRETRLRKLPEKRRGVTADFRPQPGIERGEKGSDRRAPRPPQVAGKGDEGLQVRRESGCPELVPESFHRRWEDSRPIRGQLGRTAAEGVNGDRRVR
jgi:hypothetical protein